MTALDRYVRLEAVGIWRESPEASPREVVVSFGKATLLLTDPTDAPLGHWALAGVEVIAEQDGATIYSMSPDGAETLAIRDTEMIAAITEVTRDLPKWPPARISAKPERKGRAAGLLILLVGLAVLAALTPQALRRVAIATVPPEQATEFGDRILLALMETGGALCNDPPGQRVLDRIAALALPPPAPRVRVLDLGGGWGTVLPGGTILLDRSAVSAPAQAADLAQWIAGIAAGEAPVAAMMRAAGPAANLRHVLTGDPGPEAIHRAAEEMRRTASRPPAEVPLPPIAPHAPADAVALIHICD